MKKQFTCAVSMAVTEEQFNKDLRQPLIDLGYSINVYDSENYHYIVNNPSGNYGRICNYSDNAKNDYNRHFIDTYNPKLFLALASLTTESTETKEEVLARFENKIEERELIGYRFRNDDFNKMTFAIDYDEYGKFALLPQGYHFSNLYEVGNTLKSLNLLETFCEPVYKEIKTISIEEAERILRIIGRKEKIKA